MRIPVFFVKQSSRKKVITKKLDLDRGCPNARRRPKKTRRDFPPPKKAAPWANTHNAAGSREPGVLVPPCVAACGAFRFEHKRQREAGAFTFTQRARRKEMRGRGGGAALLLEGGAERRRVPGYPSGALRRCGQAHMAKSKFQHAQPGIRHANWESHTRIGPRTNLDSRHALVAFRCRSRAPFPASNESEGDEHEESHVACHPSVAPRTVRFLAEFRATSPSFRATSAGKQN